MKPLMGDLSYQRKEIDAVPSLTLEACLAEEPIAADMNFIHNAISLLSTTSPETPQL
jgi:hypothetical protein